jgi:hypothetical protein
MSRDEIKTRFNRVVLAVIVFSLMLSFLATCDVLFAGGTNYKPSSILDGIIVAAGALLTKIFGNAMLRFTDD